MRRRYWEAYAASTIILVSGILLLHHANFSHTVSAAEAPASVSWTSFGGSSGGDQYSALSQINRTNAGKLQQVWFYPSGNNGFRYGSNPLVIDGVMFVYGK